MAEKGESNKDNSFGIISFVFGVLSVLFIPLIFFAFAAPLAALVLSILGLIFGIKQVNKSKNSLAVAGIVLSSIGLIVNGLILLRVLSVVAGFLRECKAAGGCSNYLQQLANQQAQNQLNQYASQSASSLSGVTP